MTDFELEKNSVLFTRWIARVWGTGNVVLVVLFALMHVVSPDAPGPTRSEWIGVVFFPIGVGIGLVLAWRWEVLGGTISVASFLAFYGWMVLSGSNVPNGPYFALAAAPGALYLVCQVLSHRPNGREAPGAIRR
ncbi:MAG: hypothetical protein KAJ37_08945 [Candidatus Krumholzibacteria bacterium]|nr:hypothetical protein [Candidatus Krumholzibacteria bacterium]